MLGQPHEVFLPTARKSINTWREGASNLPSTENAKKWRGSKREAAKRNLTMANEPQYRNEYPLKVQHSGLWPAPGSDARSSILSDPIQAEDANTLLDKSSPQFRVL